MMGESKRALCTFPYEGKNVQKYKIVESLLQTPRTGVVSIVLMVQSR